MSQNKKILDHLNNVGSISFLEAWTLYSVRSLTRRIKDLREAGHEIISENRRDHTASDTSVIAWPDNHFGDTRRAK